MMQGARAPCIVRQIKFEIITDIHYLIEYSILIRSRMRHKKEFNRDLVRTNYIPNPLLRSDHIDYFLNGSSTTGGQVPMNDHQRNQMSQRAYQLVCESVYNATTTSTVYTNYTDTNVLVLDRWNKLTMVPPSRLPGPGFAGRFMIEIIQVRDNKSPSVGDPDWETYAERNKIMHSTAETNNHYSVEQCDRTACMRTVSCYHIDNFPAVMNKMDYNGSCYFEELDLCLALPGNDYTMLHPNTSTLGQFVTQPVFVGMLNLRFYINDPDYRYEKAFTVIGGCPIEIPIKRDINQEAKLWYYNSMDSGDTFKNCPLELEDEYPIEIYASRQDALNSVNNKLLEHRTNVLKKELQQEKAEIDMIKHEQSVKEMTLEAALKDLERERLRADRAEEAVRKREQAERDAKIAEERARAERAKAKTEKEAQEEKAEKIRNERKYERSSHWRKMLLESVKMITTVVSAAISIFALYKLKSS